MRCDVLAVGTELLLGQIVDTNSAWIGEQLAAAGIDSYLHVQVGDNQARMVAQLRALLADADAVIVCGGLGPTQDDITREAIAEVMGAPLERRDDLADAIREMFASRGRSMPASNLRQADVPKGGEAIPNPNGTAPGLLCPVNGKVVYAVPGVPHEMRHMVASAVVPHLLDRSGERGTIMSRSLKTWPRSRPTAATSAPSRPTCEASGASASSGPMCASSAGGRGSRTVLQKLSSEAANTATPRAPWRSKPSSNQRRIRSRSRLTAARCSCDIDPRRLETVTALCQLLGIKGV